MPTLAHTISDAIQITASYILEGETVLETDCYDYDHYRSLPAVVRYDGIICSKTGWSSDRNYACYKSRGRVAFRVA